MDFPSDVFDLAMAVVLKVKEKDTGTVLLALGLGIPAAGIIGFTLHSSGNTSIGNLFLSAATVGILPFVTLACQAIFL